MNNESPTVSMTVEALAEQHMAMTGLVLEVQELKRIVKQAQNIINQLEATNALQANTEEKGCACGQAPGEVPAAVDEA